MTTQYLTINEIAKNFFSGKISNTAIYRLVKIGDIPSIRVGSKYLIPIDKLKEKYGTNN